MARPVAGATDRRDADAGTRLVVAGARRFDDLAGMISAEVAGALPESAGGLRVGTTSLAPRDEAARAARWVARVGARRGVPAALECPSPAPIAGWRTARLRDTPARPGAAHQVSVGVARLDLSPVIAAVDQPYAVGLWLPLEGRRQRIRRQVTSEPDQQRIDAAMDARPVATVLIGRDGEIAIAVVGRDLLAVEVVGRAIRSAAQPVGDLGMSPWESAVVQRGIEGGAGVTHPDLIDVEAMWLGDPRDRGHDRLHRIVATATARAGITTRA